MALEAGEKGTLVIVIESLATMSPAVRWKIRNIPIF